MAVTRRITALLLGFEKDHRVSETGFVAVLGCRGGERAVLTHRTSWPGTYDRNGCCGEEKYLLPVKGIEFEATASSLYRLSYLGFCLQKRKLLLRPLCDVTPCSFVRSCQYVEGMCCLLLLDGRVLCSLWSYKGLDLDMNIALCEPT